jgi:hypothetical protein
MPRFIGGTVLLLVSLLASRANAHGAPADLVKARQFFFGAENVDARSGAVDKDKVVFSWLTNSTIAAAVKGRVVLLDSYVHRAETEPGRTPFVVEDLLNLKPEAIFLGHGHFDHADNAAFLAGKLGIPIHASAETCGDMQTDARALFNAGTIPVSTVDCRDVTSTGSTPGAELVRIPQLEPVACISAFRHLHSTTTPKDTAFPIAPVRNNPEDVDVRDADMYQPGTRHSYPAARGPGGGISIYYQFVLRGDNRFTFVWHNTTGALKEGCSIDKPYPNCWGPAVGQRVTERIKALPPTDVEFGSLVSLGWPTNGMRDPVLYNVALHPKVYIPVHQTDAARPTTSLWFKIAWLKQLENMNVAAADRPEARWLVDPDDYVRPMVYDPKDKRWAKPRSNGPCGGGDHDDGDHDD